MTQRRECPTRDYSLGNIEGEQKKVAMDARRFHVEFSANILKISSRTSLGTFFYPSVLQTSRLSRRDAHRRSGGTTLTNEFFRSDHMCRTVAQNNLSGAVSVGLGMPTIEYREVFSQTRLSDRRLGRTAKHAAEDPTKESDECEHRSDVAEK
jgi:hypothetical protein